LPGQALAGPPEGVSGRMVLDEVAIWVGQYRKADDDVRMAMLKKLRRANDPRIAVELVEHHTWIGG
jgi:hypothetical protein